MQSNASTTRLRSSAAVSRRSGSTIRRLALGLDRIQPGALDGEEAGNDSTAPTGEHHLPVVLFEPGVYLSTDMPGSVIPHHDQEALALRSGALRAPFEEGGRDRAHRPAFDQAQPDLICALLITRLDEQSVASNCLGVGVCFGDRLVDQP